MILKVSSFALNKHPLNLSPSFSGEVVQGHDAAGPDERAPHGVVRQQARPHPQGRRRDRLRKLLLHRRQQVNYLSRQCRQLMLSMINLTFAKVLPTAI